MATSQSEQIGAVTCNSVASARKFLVLRQTRYLMTQLQVDDQRAAGIRAGTRIRNQNTSDKITFTNPFSEINMVGVD